MAIASVNFYSGALNKDTCVELILPERKGQWPRPAQGKTYPVLYLLHGHSSDHTSWLKSSRLEWILRNKDLIVVCPDGDRGFYVDGVYTHKYHTFLTEELPVIIGNFLPVSGRREDTYIGGLSMGGYGALNAGLFSPGTYGGIIALSPVIDPFSMDRSENARAKGSPPMDNEDSMTNIEAVFGSKTHFIKNEHNLLYGLSALSGSGRCSPKFYVCCGEDDFLYGQALGFLEEAKKYPDIDLTFKTGRGMHDWDFWDREIAGALEFFNLI